LGAKHKRERYGSVGVGDSEVGDGIVAKLRRGMRFDYHRVPDGRQVTVGAATQAKEGLAAGPFSMSLSSGEPRRRGEDKAAEVKLVVAHPSCFLANLDF
jgi:hypothetical protein